MDLRMMENISSIIQKRLPFRGFFALEPILGISEEGLRELSGAEKEEFDSFAHLKRQREYLSSRLLLKKLSGELGVVKGDFRILKDDLGQPYGQDRSQQYYVSIAHSTEDIFCGITENDAIGVDLEPVDRSVPERLRPRILHPGENDLFGRMDLIRLWTIKEAYIKLRGQGLRMNMTHVLVTKGSSDFEVELNNDKTAKICSFQAGNNWLAIAYYQ